MNPLIKKVIRFFSSLKLTLALLGIAMVLVFIGTLAQVNLGIYQAQKQYFETFFVWAEVGGGSFSIPVFPGGFTITTFLLINLIAAGKVYFRLTWKKGGITLIHAGVVLLILGGLATSYFAVESQLSFEEGQTRNYAEDSRNMELVFISQKDKQTDHVVSIPQDLLHTGKHISHPDLPFTIDVQTFYANADLSMVPEGSPGILPANQGLGRRVAVREMPIETQDNRLNLVTALLHLKQEGTTLGRWVVTNGFGILQKVQVDQKTYWFAIRQRRYYTPYYLTLKDFTHDRYPGTDIPKNFSSLVHLENPINKEARDVLIYMNHPLRYDGKTYYQASFGKNDTLSVLQVVKNPAWQIPYVACTLISLGMLFHFISRLIVFLRKEKS